MEPQINLLNGQSRHKNKGVGFNPVELVKLVGWILGVKLH